MLCYQKLDFFKGDYDCVSPAPGAVWCPFLFSIFPIIVSLSLLFFLKLGFIHLTVKVSVWQRCHPEKATSSGCVVSFSKHLCFEKKMRIKKHTIIIFVCFTDHVKKNSYFQSLLQSLTCCISSCRPLHCYWAR